MRAEAIIADYLDPRDQGARRRDGRACQAAERCCERYLVDASAASCPSVSFHLTVPMLAELQKLAYEVQHACVRPFMTRAEGEPPTGITVDEDDAGLLTSVICYATSRPGVRWVLGETVGFDDVTATLAGEDRLKIVVKQSYSKVGLSPE
jgi:hypothetical protein